MAAAAAAAGWRGGRRRSAGGPSISVRIAHMDVAETDPGVNRLGQHLQTPADASSKQREQMDKEWSHISRPSSTQLYIHHL